MSEIISCTLCKGLYYPNADLSTRDLSPEVGDFGFIIYEASLVSVFCKHLPHHLLIGLIKRSVVCSTAGEDRRVFQAERNSGRFTSQALREKQVPGLKER